MLEPTRRTRSEIELASQQLRAVAAWHRARRAAEVAAQAPAGSREERMDLDRRLEVLQAQHEAIVRRAEEALAGGVRVMRAGTPLRAVVAHRNQWFADKLCADLVQRGVSVVARTDNGAEAVGVTVAEQPDLLLVEDRLAMLPGEDVVRQARTFAPSAVIAAQVAYEDRIAVLLEAGADSAYARRVPPVSVAQGLADLLDERQPA